MLVSFDAVAFIPGLRGQIAGCANLPQTRPTNATVPSQDTLITGRPSRPPGDRAGTWIYTDHGNLYTQRAEAFGANEGKPTESYLADPPGLISVIDLAEGLRRATVDFAEFNNNNAAGVRISGPNFLTPDPNDTATVAQDVELEHIATSADSRTAWIPLPENNALAVLDVSKGEVRDILPFGVKDHALLGNGLDPSDADGGINIGPWPVKGMYMPTQIATYKMGSETYLVSANSERIEIMKRLTIG